MKDLVNRKIKRCESFRPLVPSLLEEQPGEWFTIGSPDPFMLNVYPIRPEKWVGVAAVTHVDGTGPIQTVSERPNPRYWRLISAFARQTGVPIVDRMLVNQS